MNVSRKRHGRYEVGGSMRDDESNRREKRRENRGERRRGGREVRVGSAYDGATMTNDRK